MRAISLQKRQSCCDIEFLGREGQYNILGKRAQFSFLNTQGSIDPVRVHIDALKIVACWCKIVVTSMCCVAPLMGSKTDSDLP